MDRAITDSTEAIRLQPLSVRAFTFRAKMYKRAGDNEHAEADFAVAEQLSEFSGTEEEAQHCRFLLSEERCSREINVTEVIVSRFSGRDEL